MKNPEGALKSNNVFKERLEIKISDLTEKEKLYPNNYGIKTEKKNSQAELNRINALIEQLKTQIKSVTN